MNQNQNQEVSNIILMLTEIVGQMIAAKVDSIKDTSVVYENKGEEHEAKHSK